MRQEWSPEELLANWTLVDGDWDLVANKSGATRLGFSLLLKFFELEGRFPDVLEEVPPVAVEYVADLVKVPATDFTEYTLVGHYLHDGEGPGSPHYRRCHRRGQLPTGYRLVIATRLKAFITVASQAIAETWSVVSMAAAAL